MSDSMTCAGDVFTNGQSLLAIDGRSAHVEPWVQSVAALSAQRVDWHYSGGVAHVLVLGDHAKAMAAVDDLEKYLVGRIMRRYAADGTGLYRAGVTEAPPDAIGAITTSGETEWIVAAPAPGPAKEAP